MKKELLKKLVQKAFGEDILETLEIQIEAFSNFHKRLTSTVMNSSLKDVVELSEDEADNNAIGSHEPSALHSVVLSPPEHLDKTLAEVVQDKCFEFLASSIASISS